MEYKQLKEITFEAAVSELEKIALELEDAEVPLKRAVQLFERGSELKQFCDSELQSAKLKVEKIVTDNSKFVELQQSPLQEKYEDIQ